MKIYHDLVQKLHQLFILIQLDDFFTANIRTIKWFQKCIPGHHLYPKGTLKKVKRDGVLFSLDVSDYMQWYIYTNLPEAAWLFATQSISNDIQKPTIIDIGSNVGEFSWKCSHYLHQHRLDGKTIAFDPNPAVKSCFLNNGLLNPELIPFVIFENKAVGDMPGKVSFHYSDVNTGVGKIDGDGQNAVQSEVITLDEYIASNQIEAIHFIKIDVEGFEPKVIEGAKSSIEQFKPILYIEITESWHQKYGCTSKTIFDFLKGLGYCFFQDIDGVKVSVKDPFEIATRCHQINILAEYK
jgi:FkbM family methyltransferase